LEIICITTKAATQVMVNLSAAGLHPRQDFKIGSSSTFEYKLPLVFTLVRPLTDPVLKQIRAVSDVTIDS